MGIYVHLLQNWEIFNIIQPNIQGWNKKNSCSNRIKNKQHIFSTNFYTWTCIQVTQKKRLIF